MNPIANNPVITKDIGTLAIFFVAWKLLGLSLGESAAIAGTFNAGASPFIRQLVYSPATGAKLEAKLAELTTAAASSSTPGWLPAPPDPGKRSVGP